MGFLSAHVTSKVNDQDVRDPKSRADYYREAKKPLPLPNVPEGGAYLVDAMNDLGPLRQTSESGLRAADWPEIAAFIAATQDITEHWEAKALHRMCGAYFSGFTVGEKPLGKEPMQRER